MQFAKDSFYMALRSRLAALDPARVVSVDGVPMIAVLVSENSPDYSEKPQPGTYYLNWGACRSVAKQSGGKRPLFGIECNISYWTAGTSDSGVDRGRVLGQLDDELIAICRPPSTAKQDFTQSPCRDLGSAIFWTSPILNQVEHDKSRNGAVPSRALWRSAAMTVFFSPEADLS